MPLGGRGDRLALIGEREDGEVRTLTYAELKREVDAIAAGPARARACSKGDPVAVFMPMVPEAVVAAYAIAKLGAVYMPIFSGFAPSAVAARLQDAEGQGDLHRRRRPAARRAGADEAGRRRGRGGVAVGRARDRARAARRRRADAGRPRPDLGRAARARRGGRADGIEPRGHRAPRTC